MSNFDLTARIIPEPIPSVTGASKYLQLVVTHPDGTRITELPRRQGASVTEPLNTAGSGTVTIPRNDLFFDHYPDMLDYDNLIQFWLNNDCVSAIRIKEKTITFTSDGESISLNIQVTGPTVHDLMRDFIIKHEALPRPDSTTSRAYDWTSHRGEWYHATQWDHKVLSWTKKNPPTPQKKHNPKHWRVPSARWIGFRGEWKYLRRNFHIPVGGMHVRFYASADENFRLFLDGDEVLSDQHHEIGYKSYVTYDTFIRGGKHTIAVRTRARPSKHGDGWDNFIFAMCRINKRGRRILPPILVSDSRWEAHAGNPPPAWNRAEVLRSIIKEAKARGGTSADVLTLGFSATTDSGGAPWTDRWNKPLDVGTTGVDAQAQLSESGNFDVWVDPLTLTVKAWNFRGVNRSASIALLPGVNLLDYSVTETDEVLNDVLVQYDGGWVNARLPSSIQKYGRRETYAELGDIKDPETARLTMNHVLRGLGRTNKNSGSVDIKTRPEGVPAGSIIPVEGMFPMIDWRTGDVISAYNIRANLAPHRVMSLTLNEDEVGYLSFDSDLQEVDTVV